MIRSRPWSGRRTVWPLYYEPFFFNMLFVLAPFIPQRGNHRSARGIRGKPEFSLESCYCLGDKCSRIFFHFSTPVKMYSDKILPKLIYNFSPSLKSMCTRYLAASPLISLYTMRGTNLKARYILVDLIEILLTSTPNRSPVDTGSNWCFAQRLIAVSFKNNTNVAHFQIRRAKSDTTIDTI